MAHVFATGVLVLLPAPASDPKSPAHRRLVSKAGWFGKIAFKAAPNVTLIKSRATVAAD